MGQAMFARSAILMLLFASSTAAAQDRSGIESFAKNGRITLYEAQAVLELGNRYDFYGPNEARTIIVDIWENRPDQADGVLGIIMPAGVSPRDEGWGGSITYEATGWVSNEDARNADYDALLREMQEQARADNLARRKEGYPAIEIVGWAQEPQYDSVSHTLVWARELDFDDSDTNALTYDMRLLGREGVLSINFVTDMDKLPAIRRAAGDVVQSAQFKAGARYEDYEEASDDAAGYGLAGLVASGAGLAVAKQLGFFALLLKFAKPLLVGLGIALALFFAPARRWLRDRKGKKAAA